MSYLITAHIVQDEPDVNRLDELPASIGWRVYHHQSADVYLIDAYRAAKPVDYPFQTPVPATDIPLELSENLKSLEELYQYLYQHDAANSFKKSYINFALLLNQLLELPVLSIISDDEEWDFAVTVQDGFVERLKCRCDDLIVDYNGGQTSIQPLVPEFEEDAEFLTDLGELRKAVPGVKIADRNVPWEVDLHAIVIEEWKRFADTESLILGLGSFDPPEDESDWRLIRGS